MAEQPVIEQRIDDIEREQPGFMKRFWRHVNRGTYYHVVGEATLRATFDVREGDCLIVYLGPDGQMWARPRGEFYDGRFERVATGVEK